MNTIKLLPVIGLIFLGACSSSRVTHSWKSEFPAKNYNKILVIALSGTDMFTRQKMEDHLVGDLSNQGYNATSSLKEFGAKAFRQMNEEAVLDKLQNSGFDAVITIVLLDKEKERYYVPGRMNYSPYAFYYHRFWGYYTTIYDRVYTPGYYITNTKYFWESNLFDVSSKELIYSVQTESFDPASSEMLAHEYGKLIVKDMVKNQVLSKKELVAKDGHNAEQQ
ncbi:hypothetical protein A3860_22720 [Niastella vici]|uniref:DUF4136 domain-containing protein n=1 Tax=Niastella vici TaxID=1703345 RepID=A0A1V9FZK3_9BACT|nr:hypothetical protein [Niastella vici]OQP63757.1 hypothetical protein A3860_22720 [Niastella vici]